MSLQNKTNISCEPPPSGPEGGVSESLISRAYTFHRGST